MLTVLRISVAPSAPKLSLDPDVALRCGPFDGTSKAALFPDEMLSAKVEDPAVGERQFVSMAPGVLVLSEKAWAGANDMYYCCTMSGELLAIKTQHGHFQAINPVDPVPQATGGDAPCDVSQFYAPIFRIAGRDPTHLFCVEGLGADQFKLIYEELGFTGLVFEEIWRGEDEVSG
jgi:hypothetical protein